MSTPDMNANGTTQATSALPSFRRAWLIASRDFMGYVKTWGFWLSFAFPILFGVIGFVFATSDFEFAPPRYETILDDTGVHGAALIEYQAERDERTRIRIVREMSRLYPEDERDAFRARVDENGSEAGLAELRERYPDFTDKIEFPESRTRFVDPPADTLEGLMPYLRGERTITAKGEAVKLNGVYVIKGTADAPVPEYWSRNINDPSASSLVKSYLRKLAKSRYLESGGLTAEGYDDALDNRAELQIFNPDKTVAGDENAKTVSMWDRLPFFVGVGLSFFLLLTIFTGSFMLLTSMIEEKLNKLMEMMLASTKFSEIILGKMIGAAMLTIASLLPYLLVAIIGVIGFMIGGDPEHVAAIKAALPIGNLLIIGLYLVLGYMLFAAILIAMGSLAQGMQDAQTLSLPAVIVMLCGVFILQFGIAVPDSPIITFASIFPLTSAFTMPMRLSMDPPLWQVLLSLALLALSVVAVMLLASRIFRFGVLSGGGITAVKTWFRRTVLRKA